MDLVFDFVGHLPEEKLETQGMHRNDKRIVCRYERHDITTAFNYTGNIPSMFRYWVEGKCQKEETCNFLHKVRRQRLGMNLG
jgi:hypothetical protein